MVTKQTPYAEAEVETGKHKQFGGHFTEMNTRKTGRGVELPVWLDDMLEGISRATGISADAVITRALINELPANYSFVLQNLAQAGGLGTGGTGGGGNNAFGTGTINNSGGGGLGTGFVKSDLPP